MVTSYYYYYYDYYLVEVMDLLHTYHLWFSVGYLIYFRVIYSNHRNNSRRCNFLSR